MARTYRRLNRHPDNPHSNRHNPGGTRKALALAGLAATVAAAGIFGCSTQQVEPQIRPTYASDLPEHGDARNALAAFYACLIHDDIFNRGLVDEVRRCDVVIVTVSNSTCTDRPMIWELDSLIFPTNLEVLRWAHPKIAAIHLALGDDFSIPMVQGLGDESVRIVYPKPGCTFQGQPCFDYYVSAVLDSAGKMASRCSHFAGFSLNGTGAVLDWPGAESVVDRSRIAQYATQIYRQLRSVYPNALIGQVNGHQVLQSTLPWLDFVLLERGATSWATGQCTDYFKMYDSILDSSLVARPFAKWSIEASPDEDVLRSETQRLRRHGWAVGVGPWPNFAPCPGYPQYSCAYYDLPSFPWDFDASSAAQQFWPSACEGQSSSPSTPSNPAAGCAISLTDGPDGHVQLVIEGMPSDYYLTFGSRRGPDHPNVDVQPTIGPGGVLTAVVPAIVDSAYLRDGDDWPTADQCDYGGPVRWTETSQGGFIQLDDHNDCSVVYQSYTSQLWIRDARNLDRVSYGCVADCPIVDEPLQRVGDWRVAYVPSGAFDAAWPRGIDSRYDWGFWYPLPTCAIVGTEWVNLPDFGWHLALDSH